MPSKGHRFTSARFYEVPKGWRPDPKTLSAALFKPTDPTQELSWGFVPPRSTDPGDYPFSEVIAGLHIIRLRSQSRNVPTSAINDEVAKMAARIEQETGRKPGKRQTKELKEDARQSLLPRAFTRDSESWGIVCPVRGLLVVNSASPSGSARLPQELIATHTLPEAELARRGLSMNVYSRPLRTKVSAEAFMLRALLEPDAVSPFGPATYCVLAAQDESRRQVSYRNHELLGNKEILRHLEMGHMPSKLGLYLESNTYFEIDTGLGLSKVHFSEDLFQHATPADGAADAFDGDFTLLGAALLRLYDDLAAALEVERMDDPDKPSLV